MSKDKPILSLKKVSKFYYNKGLVASGFSKISLDFYLGEFVVITGESGCGKSTLLNVLSGLDTYEEGEMYINGMETSHYSNEEAEHYRKSYIGNIFQSFNLVSSYTVYQNIELVLLLNGFKKKDIKNKVIELIKEVDLYKYRNSKVSHLSGGQKQRVAIARALAKDVPIIIADEPTGNLDRRSAASIMKLLAKVAKDKLVIVVTHNYEDVDDLATRKIEMHDGKVREDITIKPYEESKASLHEYKNISFLNKIRLGVRNTFNLPMKFILLLMVFLLITFAFLGIYSSFRKAEYEENKNGYNYYFSDLSDERIVIKKSDNSVITNEELDKISKLDYVKSVVKDDIILDTTYSLTDDNTFWFYGNVKSIRELKPNIEGQKPINDNEIILETNKNNYYVSTLKDKLKETKLSLRNTDNVSSSNKDLKVTGFVLKDNEYDNDIFYVSDDVLEKIKINSYENYSKVTITLNNQKVDLLYSVSDKVPKGKAVVPYELNVMCKYSWCKNNILNINVKNIYYENNIDLEISDMYLKYNFEQLTGVKDYENNNSVIYISKEDYLSLFNMGTYQSSIYLKDVKDIPEAKCYLESNGFKPLFIKDAKINYSNGVLEVIKIFKLIVMTIIFIVLFFIAYFVIRLIEKSRNVYYATLRILGATKKVLKNLINIELFLIYHIAFALILGLCILVKNNIIVNNNLYDMVKYLGIKDYIFVYVICFVMSILISFRYSRKLFNSSAMKTYREEAE